MFSLKGHRVHGIWRICFMAGGVEFGAYVFLTIEEPARRQETRITMVTYIHKRDTLEPNPLPYRLYVEYSEI